MLSKPSRLLTALLMLPTWGFAHAVLIFKILPTPARGALNPDAVAPFIPLIILTAIAAAFASFITARRASALGWKTPRLLGLLIHLPFVGAGLALWITATGDEQESAPASPTTVAGRLVVPFILGFLACLALTWGFDTLEKTSRIPLGLKQTGGYFGLAIFAGLPFATGVSSGVTLRRAGGTFGQAIGASMTLIGTVVLILCAGRPRATIERRPRRRAQIRHHAARAAQSERRGGAVQTQLLPRLPRHGRRRTRGRASAGARRGAHRCVQRTVA